MFGTSNFSADLWTSAANSNIGNEFHWNVNLNQLSLIRFKNIANNIRRIDQDRFFYNQKKAWPRKSKKIIPV